VNVARFQVDDMVKCVDASWSAQNDVDRLVSGRVYTVGCVYPTGEVDLREVISPPGGWVPSRFQLLTDPVSLADQVRALEEKVRVLESKLAAVREAVAQ
jgi:hypothetical protein